MIGSLDQPTFLDAKRRLNMRICLLEPFHTGSHAAWVDGYVAHSAHQVTPLTLTGQFWKWRMHGGAVTLARMYREREIEADLILASDMLDLSTFLALTRDLTHHTPAALYMHENQLTYPLRPGEKRDLHYGFINYASMLCARRVFFNSQYHLESWFYELPRLLKHFPDYNEIPTVSMLRQRSEVLPLGLSLGQLDQYRSTAVRSGPPLLLWNHRWEYDKNPAEFLQALYALAERGVDFRVVLLGEAFVRVPPEFDEARQRLGHRIAQFGYVDSYADYARWLWQADIVVSTAIHDFFGAAVVEAMYCDCFPILPRRLAYPQFAPESYRDRCLYRDHEEFLTLLTRAIDQVAEMRVTSLRQAVARYDWVTLAPEYDRRFDSIVSTA
jgi:glycosyltransferase involved in cell wall biosynthesis